MRESSSALYRLIDTAARRITRLTPNETDLAVTEGAVLIDIRSEDVRARDGIVPGSLHIPRTVLEWRIALDSPWRSPYIGGPDEGLILICDHGFSSILAASTLVDLGFTNAGDVIGGYQAWCDAGLPTAPYTPRELAEGELPGMAGPDPLT